MTTTATDRRLSDSDIKQVQKFVLSYGPLEMTIPALVVHHLRHGLHLLLKDAAERVALEAQMMATAAENDPRVEVAGTYRMALSRFDEVRGAFEHVGLGFGSMPKPSRLGDGLAYLQTEAQRRAAADRAAGLPADDATISLVSSFDVLHCALMCEVESTDNAPAAIVELLDELDGLVEKARAAHAEWASRPRG
jgi:hypothetical protein